MLFYKLSGRDFERVKEIEKITGNDYELLGDFLPYECLVEIMQDLLLEYDILQESYDNYKQYVADNFKQKSDAELVGYNENW